MLSVACSAQADMTEDISIGKYTKIESIILGETRTLSVYLPAGYNDGNDTYPVLYLLDGYMKSRLMHTAGTMEMLASSGALPSMIIIGIDNVNGTRDYFPQPIESRPGSGQAETFIRFLEEELIPFVEKNYRVNSYRVLSGASNSGMLTVYTLLTHPELFASYIAASPSVGWFPDFMTDKVKQVFSRQDFPARSIYMNYGTDDLESIVLNAIDTFTAVCREYAPENLRWTMERIENGGHVPYISVYNGLRFVFPDWQCPDSISKSADFADIRRYYEQLADKYGFAVKIPSEHFSTCGIDNYRAGNFDKAIEIFSEYAGQYPGSSRAKFYLGSVYLRMGDTASAVIHYRAAVDIDPNFGPAADKLKELTESTNP